MPRHERVRYGGWPIPDASSTDICQPDHLDILGYCTSDCERAGESTKSAHSAESSGKKSASERADFRARLARVIVSIYEVMPQRTELPSMNCIASRQYTWLTLLVGKAAGFCSDMMINGGAQVPMANFARKSTMNWGRSCLK